MRQILLMVLPTALMLGTMFIVMFPAIWLSKLRKRGKRSPLTGELLRSPGEALRLHLDDLNFEINSCLFGSTIIPLAAYASLISQIHFAAVNQTRLVIYLYSFIAICFLIYLIIKLSKAFNRRNDLRLGLDAEMAIGQELNQLMLQGYRVYHDFPADNFNIDHIVFGPNGVFAVETKGRAKPTKDSTKDGWKVIFDGNALQFPNWTEREYINQARRQAEWLSKWLSKAVGEKIQVKPVLALPGWHITRLKPSNVLFINGKDLKSWSVHKTNNPLTDSLITRIIHQIEQKCRNVEPSAYKADKKAN